VVLDMATSRSSWGVLFTAAQSGGTLPEGCFLDAEGRPTTDPQAVLAGGALLPIADYKGYGLALCLGLLTGLLSDGHFDADLPHPYKFLDQPGRNAFFMGAIRVDQFLPPERFKARVDEVVRLLRNTPRAPGVERIYLPGEKEWEAAQERRQTGIPLPPPMVAELRALAASCGADAGCLGVWQSGN
jgi:LDH2 family malate/lactate/ureidoglycolate dehydrogenase